MWGNELKLKEKWEKPPGQKRATVDQVGPFLAWLWFFVNWERFWQNPHTALARSIGCNQLTRKLDDKVSRESILRDWENSFHKISKIWNFGECYSNETNWFRQISQIQFQVLIFQEIKLSTNKHSISTTNKIRIWKKWSKSTNKIFISTKNQVMTNEWIK